jgi:competence ComEA-like helix-hairpin-helix protein
VIEPGEFASEADEGPTVDLREETLRVGPIVFCDELDLLPRGKAEEELGLQANRTRALIQLGEVPAQQRDPLMQQCAARILREPEAEVAILESAISETLELPEGVIKLSATYPIARLYRAFDFVISAAGYNSYHELICFQIPTAFFPVARQTDNQAARARYAQEVGVGVELAADANGGLDDLLQRPQRRRMTARARKLRFANGADAAADAIGRLALARRATRGKPRVRRRSVRRRAGQRRLAQQGRPRLAASSPSRVSLRAITTEQLGGIEGIGPVTAKKIIAFRKRRGGVSSIEELAEVRGVGPATMNALRARLRP